MTKNYKYIYGPVPSWRLGSSLGIDPLSKDRKVCTFDCVYCQLGETRFLTDERKIFVPVAEIIEELDSLPTLKIDYITFSGTRRTHFSQKFRTNDKGNKENKE